LKKDDVPKFFNRNNVLKILISLGFLVLVIALYPKTQIQETAYSIGEPWRDDDLIAPFTFSIMKQDEEIRAEIRDIRQHTSPIFLLDHQAEARLNTAAGHAVCQSDRGNGRLCRMAGVAHAGVAAAGA
jgi:cyclic-di-AMP phosphodiesterase PgpH